MHGSCRDSNHACEQHSHPSRNTSTATDPTCGMAVDVTTAKHKHRHHGQDCYFCSAHCLTKFREDPARYAISGTARAREKAAGHDSESTLEGAETVYTRE